MTNSFAQDQSQNSYLTFSPVISESVSVASFSDDSMWAHLAAGAAPPTPESPRSVRGISVSDWQNSCEDDMSWAINEDCFLSGSDSTSLGPWDKDTPKKLSQSSKMRDEEFPPALGSNIWNVYAPLVAQDLPVFTSYMHTDRPTMHPQCISPTSSSASYRRPRSMPMAMQQVDHRAMSSFDSSPFLTSPELLSMPDTAYSAGANSPEYRLHPGHATNDLYGCSPRLDQSMVGSNGLSGSFTNEQPAFPDFNYSDFSLSPSHEQTYPYMGPMVGSQHGNPPFTEGNHAAYYTMQYPFHPAPTATYPSQYPQATTQPELHTQGPYQPIAIKREDQSESSTASASLTPILNNPRTRPSEQTKCRDHYMYRYPKSEDGHWHCPYAATGECSHAPTKLKCNYDKYIDSHIKPFNCKDASCNGQAFSSTACLLRHEREAHGLHGHGEKPHLCHYAKCDRAKEGKGFPRHYNLMDHMRRMHGHEGEEQAVPKEGGKRRRTGRKGRQAGE